MNVRLLAVVMALTLFAVISQAIHAQVDRVQEMNGIVFVSGGIGADSREDLAAREKSYNFKLVTTLEGSGSFISGARVILATAQGDKLVEHVTDGPIMLAGLPAGAYVVIASFRGITHTRKFQVRAERLHTEHLRWPVDPSQDVVLPPEFK
ncbi:MAG: hypothetical protein FJY56_15930 [Betaproteobacteria bacterium]|nr:hypothetical protein [Betaproteobacteria bacterium]